MESADLVVIGAGLAASYRCVRAAAGRQGNAIASGERAAAEVLARPAIELANPPSPPRPAGEIVDPRCTTESDQREGTSMSIDKRNRLTDELARQSERTVT